MLFHYFFVILCRKLKKRKGGFMKSKKILYVCSEMTPYLPETMVANTAFEVAKSLNAEGAQIRIFMPRYGVINERRHQLHEVIRLSGMNLVVNDIDMPLIIKVASVPKERVQVYFIDNDEYFKRKEVFSEDGVLYPDNDERCIFFAKGVVETVKKLNWAPDIIHIQGWLGLLLPLYLKTHYKDEPIFADAKIITSVFDKEFQGELDAKISKKILFDGVEKKAVASLTKPNYENLLEVAIKHSEAVTIETPVVSDKILDVIVKNKKPVRSFLQEENEYLSYAQFYEKIIEGKAGMKKLRLKIEQILTLLLVFFVVSCNSDQDAVLLSQSILGDVNYQTQTIEFPLEITNHKVEGVQTNGLTSYQLGQITQGEFGQTNTSIIAQLTLSSAAPIFGTLFESVEQKSDSYNEEETVTDVFLYLPFFSKKTGTNPVTSASTYQVDSIYGNKNATFTLSVKDLDYYLSAVGTDLEAQKYFSNTQIPLKNVVGEAKQVSVNTEEIVRFNFDDPNSTTDESTTVKDRLAPGIRVKLNNDFFQRNLIDKEGSVDLENNTNFTKFLKGIAISATNFSADMLAYIDMSKAKIQVDYSYKNKKSDGSFVTKKSSYELDFSGIVFGNQKTENQSVTLSSEKIYLKGGAGYTAQISLPQTQIEFLKQKKALINQAELLLYVDDDFATAKNADYVLIHNATNGSVLADYSSDISLNNKNILSIGKIQKNTLGQKWYRLLLTDHIVQLLNSTDATPILLGLTLGQSTAEASMVHKKYKTALGEKNTLSGGAETHLATILYGNSSAVPQNKRPVLKVTYSVPK